ncbi:MAG: HD domain-containing phosphohydrolase [Fibrobacteria bacterium]
MARLVIIDDESHITDILTRFFSEKGHEVLGFTRADDALAHITKVTTDLVITDIAMKGLSGLDLLAKLKGLRLDVPVIVTTGNPSHNSAVQALRSGACDYVVKPFHLDEIAERAEKALSTKRVKDENTLYAKLVSLHSISRVTAEAASMEDLSAKVIKLGARLTGSDAGWYWVASPASDTAITATQVLYPEAESLSQHGFLVKLARATAEKMEMNVTAAEAPLAAGTPSAAGKTSAEARSAEGSDAWYLSLPVEVGSALHGALIFRRTRPAPKYDAVDLEVFNQLAATFALGIRALGLFPKAVAPDLDDGGKTLDSWARLIGQLVDEHCLGYESKGGRVEALGRALMKEMNWPAETGGSWPLICHIYDIAKVRVPQKMLEKSKILAQDELDFVRAQAAWACESVSNLPGLEAAARVMEDFQESFDGSGRPRGLSGRAIAPLARLLAVADAFVSMRSGRPYRGPLSEAEAMEVVRKGSGKRFDPEVVLALSRVAGV